MTEREQQLWDQLGELTLELSVVRLVVMHLAAHVLKNDPDCQASFRKFADNVHASIDRAGPPPSAIVARIEQSRAEVDRFLKGIEQRL